MCSRVSHGRCCCCNSCPPRCPSPSSNSAVKYTTPEEVRKHWEEWDASVLILFILFTQLFLLLFGQTRTKAAKKRIMISVSAWLLYLLSELVATIALGKLSKVESVREPQSPFRILWAPPVLFFLGGPDTLTVLAVEENNMWVKHLIALITLGFRATYVLYVSWTTEWYPFLALFLLFPGIIKYGERVCIIRSRAQGHREGFVQLNRAEIDKRLAGIDKRLAEIDKKLAEIGENDKATEESVKEVLQAYSFFHYLNSHEQEKLKTLIKGMSAKSAFKAIEIELGFTYDVLFSKVGSIFTLWGCLLRFISISFMVCVLVGVLVMEADKSFFIVDLPITIMLLTGAILLEVAGVLVQLVSDWAVVWTSKHRCKQMKPIFRLQACFLSKRQRWSTLMGQFHLKNFYTGDNRPVSVCLIHAFSIFCENKILEMKFSANFDKVPLKLRDVVFDKIQKSLELGTPPGSTSLENYPTQLQEFVWCAELKFHECVVIWHIATENCRLHSKSIREEVEATNSISTREVVEATKALSCYMMYLLVNCKRFPICRSDEFVKACNEVKEICKPSKAEADKAEESGQGRLVGLVKKLERVLEKEDNLWELMSKVWVEMLCYAARKCTAKQHANELRHGVEFISQVWLLLVHFGCAPWLENSDSQGLDDGSVKDASGKVVETLASSTLE